MLWLFQVFENINITDLVEDIQTIGASQICVVFIPYHRLTSSWDRYNYLQNSLNKN